MFESAGKGTVQLQIADDAFKRLANGRYELDLQKPKFEEIHKRTNEGEQGWKQRGKPRMLWAIEFVNAGGSFVVSCCVFIAQS